MNILILTSNHPQKTSGIVATDLKKALTNDNGYSVKILTCAWDNYDNDHIIPAHSNQEEYLRRLIRLPRRLINFFHRRVLKSQPVKDKTTDPNYHVLGEEDISKTYYSTEKILKRIGDFKPDKIIVLFMTRFINFKNLYELNRVTKAPIILYLMDMAPFTGGCHYAWECKSYQNKCGNCPAFYSDNENDQSRKNWEFKYKYISKTNIKVVAATEYQYQQLLRSNLFIEKDKIKILLSIDPDLFKPADQSQARDRLNLPVNKRIIFFGATNVKSKRKGYAELLESLKILSEECLKPQEIHLAIAGGGESGLTDHLPFNYTSLGRLNHTDLATAFQATDIFLCPSIEDSGPMMINQSIMCGTPVVAFEMGVALDLVRTGETGYRAKLKNTVDLANGIQQILQLNENEIARMKKKCRNMGLLLLSPQKQGSQFLNYLNDK